MTAIHPLREILDAALVKEEPRLDTEWPADDSMRIADLHRHPAAHRAPLVPGRP